MTNKIVPLLALAALMGFLLLFGWFCVDIVDAAKGGNVASVSDLALSIAASLSGLVGGVVASAFGQQTSNQAGNKTERFRRSMQALGSIVSPVDKVKDDVAIAYVIIYFLISSVSLIIAILHPVPNSMGIYSAYVTVRNIGVAAIGLLVVIVSSWFK